MPRCPCTHSSYCCMRNAMGRVQAVDAEVAVVGQVAVVAAVAEVLAAVGGLLARAVVDPFPDASADEAGVAGRCPSIPSGCRARGPWRGRIRTGTEAAACHCRLARRATRHSYTSGFVHRPSRPRRRHRPALVVHRLPVRLKQVVTDFMRHEEHDKHLDPGHRREPISLEDDRTVTDARASARYTRGVHRPASSGSRAGAPSSSCCSARMMCMTALISARWVNACGKLPRWRPVPASISSA